MLIVTSVALVAVVATVAWYSPLRLNEKLGARNFFGAALLAAWVAAAVASSFDGDARSAAAGDSDLMSAVRSIGDVDWEGGRRPHPAVGPRGSSAWSASSASAVAGGPMDVGSVEALLGGLEARLASGPADPKGWALLAQSYAFVGRDDQAEAAIVRAVELGFDETALRQRVSAATRDVQASGNWIEQTLRR